MTADVLKDLRTRLHLGLEEVVPASDRAGVLQRVDAALALVPVTDDLDSDERADLAQAREEFPKLSAELARVNALAADRASERDKLMSDNDQLRAELDETRALLESATKPPIP